jgi:hypothetical protein
MRKQKIPLLIALVSKVNGGSSQSNDWRGNGRRVGSGGKNTDLFKSICLVGESKGWVVKEEEISSSSEDCDGFNGGGGGGGGGVDNCCCSLIQCSIYDRIVGI